MQKGIDMTEMSESYSIICIHLEKGPNAFGHQHWESVQSHTGMTIFCMKWLQLTGILMGFVTSFAYFLTMVNVNSLQSSNTPDC